MMKSLNFDTKNENCNRNEIVTIKFRTDTNETLTQAFGLKTNIATLRSYLQQLLNVDLNKIVIGHEGSTLQDNQTIKDLGATSLGILELDLRGDGIQLPKPAYYLPIIDVIMVNVRQRTFIVEIERCPINKPWLGGFRDRNNGKVYHHACAQTDFKPKMYSNVVQVDRMSQTCADKSIEVVHDTCTQTSSSCIKIVDKPMKVLWAKQYQSSQTCLNENHVLVSVLKIQRAFRRSVAKRKMMSKEQAALVSVSDQKMRMMELPQQVTALESKQQIFYSFYTTVGKWWKKERQRIKNIKVDNVYRKEAQMNLLKKEIAFLLAVEKQRMELKYELTKHDDLTFLNKTSKPKIFKNKTGKLLTIDTVGNQKARVLKEIYVNITGLSSGLKMDIGPNRLNVLDELYAMVAESTYKYKKYLLDAIAMEKDIANMVCGIGKQSVQRSVQLRVEQLLRHFIRQPEVNPEAASYYHPTEKRMLNVYTCIRCKRNLAAPDFSLESRVNRTNVCANCEWAEQVGHKRIDMAPYRRMLKAVRHDEMQRAAYESECFLMQPTEVYRLVSVVWREKSAVSECNNLNGLRLVRWHRDVPWSPWNCVLLTRSEAETHCQMVGVPADYYDAQFVQQVTNRHMTARLQFSNLVQAVRNRMRAKKAKGLSTNWKTVADNFNIKII